MSSGQVVDHLQVVYSRDDQWIVASNIGCEHPTVKVFDSVYLSVDQTTKEVISSLFNIHSMEIKLYMSAMQKQTGGEDCGVFSIAVI